jgi:hypothetical protein
MTYEEFLRCDQWQLFRQVIWEHHQGKCSICGAPGEDVHHARYDAGLFNPRWVTLLCRPCHLIYRGRDPDHVPDDHPLKPKLKRAAQIARALRLDKPRVRSAVDSTGR